MALGRLKFLNTARVCCGSLGTWHLAPGTAVRDADSASGSGFLEKVATRGNRNYGTLPAESEVIVLPMPKLSHAMTHGRIAKWHISEGSTVATYDVLLTVETETLVEEAYRLDQFAGKVQLLVESQEECSVARLLAAEGQEVPVGKPIAVLCERADDAAALRDAHDGERLWRKVDNVYEQHGLPRVRLLEWQSYLAEGPPRSGCGCM